MISKIVEKQIHFCKRTEILEGKDNSFKITCWSWGEKTKPFLHYLLLFYIPECKICFQSLPCLSICHEMYFNVKPHAPGKSGNSPGQLKRLSPRLQGHQLPGSWPLAASNSPGRPVRARHCQACGVCPDPGHRGDQLLPTRAAGDRPPSQFLKTGHSLINATRLQDAAWSSFIRAGGLT